MKSPIMCVLPNELAPDIGMLHLIVSICIQLATVSLFTRCLVGREHLVRALAILHYGMIIFSEAIVRRL